MIHAYHRGLVACYAPHDLIVPDGLADGGLGREGGQGDRMERASSFF